jgi:hypothetical protein
MEGGVANAAEPCAEPDAQPAALRLLVSRRLAQSLAVMKNPSQRAARDLLWSIRISFCIGLATWTETLDRLLALREMCAPTNPAAIFAARMLVLEEWPSESGWCERNEEPPSIGGGPNDKSSVLPVGDPSSPESNEDEPPRWLYLVSSASGLSDWQFHQYDDDPYPSVPHGHKRTNHKWKLDAYQGWVFERTRQVSREPRWKMISLWNDTKFRRFAIGAIEYHIGMYPCRDDWPVPNPLRLPRRR